ncbi:hypothetical protein Nepgr_007126 [Nepenthes gracilis]|uniref:Pentatricopeptide repeat-containing protein n=1 Tax=Nepenthes gracilis TaxID=150966 RepID=A0AAD3S731_NEPGR|nr:hypothetical protein Nepgr_007126 [Nepenthes gracilis]
MSKLQGCLKSLSHRATAQLTAAAAAGTATKSFNVIINRLSSEGSHLEVIDTFSSMLKSKTPPDAHTYPSLLKACACLSKFSLGLSLHKRIILDGYSTDSYISSSLISFYAKFGCVDYARHVFDVMPERNVIPWTAMIGCHSRSDNLDRAFLMYNSMRYEGIQPSSVTMLCVLSGVSELFQLECLHASAFQSGFCSDIHLANSMLHLYGKFRRVDAARDLFEEMDRKDIVSWNSLVSGYVQIGNVKESFCLFGRMRTEGVAPDQQTFGAFLSADSSDGDVELGRFVHGQMITSGLAMDAPLATALIVFYLKFGDIKNAFEMFESVLDKDVILWTSMISGLVQNDCADKALMIFYQMLESRTMPSTATIATVLAGCAQVSSLSFGKSIHGYLLRQGIVVDIPVQNALITMYSKCGRLKQSSTIFDFMCSRDVVSWNAIVSGYAEQGDLSKALLLFNEMRLTVQRPDSITIVSLLRACASIGAFQQGKWMHNFVIKGFLPPSILVDTALVDMYSKCGDLQAARRCFDMMQEQDTVSWSTIIAGYGSHGKGEIALKLFSSFLHAGLQPNHVIFLSILFACSHNKLVSEGLSLFSSMIQDFGIEPQLEHCACIVDLLSRAGMIEDAYRFYKVTISEPTVEVLGIVLDACRAKGNTKLGEIIAGDIGKLKSVSAEKFVQLAQSYASMSRWDGVGDSWMQMKSLGLKKLPGWSYIEQQGKIATFFTDHSSHPRCEEMMWILAVLGSEMRDLKLKSSRTAFCKLLL